MDNENPQTTAIARVEARALVPQSIGEATDLATRLADATILPTHLRGRAADVLAMTMTGAELGLPPMASTRGLYVQDGKPAMYVATKLAVVRRSGLLAKFRVIESSDVNATVEMQRVGEDPVRMSFGADEAKKAGLVKSGSQYEKQPRKMFRWRVIGELIDLLFPDVVLGIADETRDASEYDGPISVGAFSAPAAAAIVSATAATEGEAAQKAATKKAEAAQKKAEKAKPAEQPAPPKPEPAAAAPTPPAPPPKAPEQPAQPQLAIAEPPPADEPEVIDAEIVDEKPANDDGFDDVNPDDRKAAEMIDACEKAETLAKLGEVRKQFAEWSKTPGAASFLQACRNAYATRKAQLEQAGSK